jgi:hypothetical protein
LQQRQQQQQQPELPPQPDHPDSLTGSSHPSATGSLKHSSNSSRRSVQHGHHASTAAAAAAVTGMTAPGNRHSCNSTGANSQQSGAPAATAEVSGGNTRVLEPSKTPRDEDLGCCPPYAAKAVWGLRYTMEDKWAAVPNLILVSSTGRRAAAAVVSNITRQMCICSHSRLSVCHISIS